MTLSYEEKHGRVSRHKADTGKKKGAGGGGYVFSSFYPTQEEKAIIRDLNPDYEQIERSLTRLQDRHLKLTIKEDTDKSVLMLLISENVPYGQPCKALAIWHSGVDRLLAQMCFWTENHLTRWAEDDRSLAEQLEFDW